jgi:hypothetical protein
MSNIVSLSSISDLFLHIDYEVGFDIDLKLIRSIFRAALVPGVLHENFIV